MDGVKKLSKNTENQTLLGLGLDMSTVVKNVSLSGGGCSNMVS